MVKTVPFIGISRHRIGMDGAGVTTLAAFHGCRLRCKYCLNPQCLGPADGLPRYTPQQLFDTVAIDNIYFIATGGGVCFGGGEPLLHPDFLREFRDLCGRSWHLTAETSLNVPRANVEAASLVVDDFIVDIKDLNPAIYKAYTGHPLQTAKGNLCSLLELVGPQHITVRVPLIPHFNTDADTERTADALRKMGVTRIDRFTYTLKKGHDESTKSTMGV